MTTAAGSQGTNLAEQAKRRLAFQPPKPAAFDPDLATGIDQGDLALPIYKVVQGLSKSHTELGHPEGRFYSGQTGQDKATIRAIVLRVQGTRTLWGDLGEAPVCGSNDRVNPSEGMLYPGPCLVCKLREDSPWRVGSTERRKRCLPTYTLLLYDLDDQVPFILRLDGSSAARFRNFLTMMTTQLKGKHYAAETVLKTSKVTNKLGTFYVVDFVLGAQLSDEAVKAIRAYAISLTAPLTAVDDTEPVQSELDQPV